MTALPGELSQHDQVSRDREELHVDVDASGDQDQRADHRRLQDDLKSLEGGSKSNLLVAYDGPKLCLQTGI